VDGFALVPQIAHTAAGRAYYMDADGVVRSLGPRGDVRYETRFPITNPQQEGSFAVSRDGLRLVGSVLTLPARPGPLPTSPSSPAGTYAMDVMLAAAGSDAVTEYHQAWRFDEQYGAGAQFIGWDTVGPVATFPSSLLTRGGGGPVQWNGARLVHFGTGSPGSQVPAPADCNPVDMVFSSGAYVCASFVLGSRAHFEVHAQDGSLLWRSPCDCLLALLSPDLQHVVVDGLGGPAVYAMDGTQTKLPSTFVQLGWLDDRTIVGHLDGSSGEVGTVTLDGPNAAVDLRTIGAYAGAILP
jgi:hypothetical protein